MWKKIAKARLRNSEVMEIRMVKTPDEEYTDAIKSFLPRYEELWLWHLNLALLGELDGLDSRFYLGLLKDRIISNVSTWECSSIGIVGHLFTAEAHRGKGACTALMKAQIQDFLIRGGKTLIGGFKPSSYPTAKHLGFESITDDSEVMRYDMCPDFDKEYFKADKTLCRDSMWKDWPGISLLFTIKGGWELRSLKHKIFGPFDYEDYFLEDMREQSKGLCTSKVLVTERGNVVGYATLTCKHRLGDDSWLLDFFIHPVSITHTEFMLNTIRWPKGKISCYVKEGCEEKRHALLNQGFKEKSVLQKRVSGKALKIILMQLEVELD